MSNLGPPVLPAPTIHPVAPRCLLGLIALALIFVVSMQTGLAAQGPRPPCGAAPQPPYPGRGELEQTSIWTRAELGDSWTPPPCTGWTGSDFRLIVALAGRIDGGLTADEVLVRFGSISSLVGLRYWSATEHRWSALITSATAVQGPAGTRPRADFSSQELRGGNAVYFLQGDNRSSGSVLYRMTVLEAGPDRLVVAMENVTAIRLLLMTLFPPEAAQTVDFLERQRDGSWGYYSLMRTRADSSFLTGGFTSSYVNRAAAFYRHIAGIPQDAVPAAAR